MFIPNQFGGSLDKNVKKDKLKGICFFDNNNPTQLAEIQNRNVKQFIIEKFNDNYHTKLTIDNKEKRPSNGAVIPKKLKESGIKFKIIFFVKYELKQQNEQELINSEQNIHNNNSTSNHVFDWFNKIIYGIPGSGKSYYIKKNIAIANKIKPENQTRIVFYPEYTYSDFIGAIRPITNTKETNDNKIYDFVAGPFIKLLKKAIDNSNENYLFIIEEINRGDAPAIFGEFFQLLDRDDNGVSEYPITNSDLSNYIYNNENKNVYIPKNLFIIATMNTNDQNIFVLDTAFKRR
jgi:5-methylcytosine-specific restriction endonuclease McrBC GTP-binding regulatory subunit McrB